MSFSGPAHHHFVADMDHAVLLVTAARSLTRAPRSDAVAGPDGGVSLGALATLADVGASNPAMAGCRPDWTATLDLSLHGTGAPLDDGPVVVDSRLVRVGSKVVVVAVDVYDGHGTEDLDDLRADLDDLRAGLDDPRGGLGGAATAGRRPTPVATGLVTFARIPRTAAPGMEGYDPASWVGQVRHRPVADPVVGSVAERIGVVVTDAAAGVAELPRTPYVLNSIGTINGGAIAVLAETAAEAMHPDTRAVDVSIHYLAQVRAGPARTTGTRVRDGVGHHVVRIDVVDAGSADHVLAVATVTLEPVRRPG